jgi:hypothetical protein
LFYKFKFFSRFNFISFSFCLCYLFLFQNLIVYFFSLLIIFLIYFVDLTLKFPKSFVLFHLKFKSLFLSIKRIAFYKIKRMLQAYRDIFPIICLNSVKRKLIFK